MILDTRKPCYVSEGIPFVVGEVVSIPGTKLDKCGTCLGIGGGGLRLSAWPWFSRDLDIMLYRNISIVKYIIKTFYRSVCVCVRVYA